jgi:hypothetical protein
MRDQFPAGVVATRFEKRIIGQCIIASIVRNACGVKSWFGRQRGADRDWEL